MPVDLRETESGNLLRMCPQEVQGHLAFPRAMRITLARLCFQALSRQDIHLGGGAGQEVEEEAPVSSQSSQSQSQNFPAIQDLPSISVAHTTYIPTHKYPPKATRAEFSRQQTVIWERLAASPAEEELWALDYIFTRVILPADRGPRQSDAYSQGRLVRERLSRWKEGEYRELWEEAVQLTAAPPKANSRRTGAPAPEQEKTLEERNAARAL